MYQVYPHPIELYNTRSPSPHSPRHCHNLRTEGGKETSHSLSAPALWCEPSSAHPFSPGQRAGSYFCDSRCDCQGRGLLVSR